jgi:CBS domain-containing protein
MRAEKLMSREVYSCSPDDTMHRAAQLMWEKDCGFLPVVDMRGTVVSVVTDRDLCMGAYMQDVRLRDSRVSTVMSRQCFTCRVDDDVHDVEKLLRDRQIRRVPVVDGTGHLVGVLTLGDLARSSQSGRFHKATGSHAVAKTLASVCEPRAPEDASTVAAE